MRKIRIGKDIYFTWQILTNKEPVPLEGRDLKLMLKNPLGRFLDFHFEIYQGNKLKFTFHGTDHKHLGTYSLTLWENYGKEGQTAVDMCEAFRLVATTCEEDSISVPNLEMAPSTLVLLPLTYQPVEAFPFLMRQKTGRYTAGRMENGRR